MPFVDTGVFHDAPSFAFGSISTSMPRRFSCLNRSEFNGRSWDYLIFFALPISRPSR
jgi:hypothetical protein